jgi:hypothetical protein
LCDLHWLGRQREALGAEEFGRVLAGHLDAESVAALLKMLDEFESKTRSS